MQNRPYKFIEILQAGAAGSVDIAKMLDQIGMTRPINLMALLETTLQTYNRKSDLSNLDPAEPKQHADIAKIIGIIRERRQLGEQKEALLVNFILKEGRKSKNKQSLCCIDTTEIIKCIGYISAAGTTETKIALTNLKPAIKADLILAATLVECSNGHESSPEMTRVINTDNHPQGEKLELANAAYLENISLKADPDAPAAYREFCDFYLFSIEGDSLLFSKLIEACYCASDIRLLHSMLEQSKNNEELQKLILNMIENFNADVDLIEKMSALFKRLKNDVSVSTQLISNCMKGQVIHTFLPRYLY